MVLQVELCISTHRQIHRETNRLSTKGFLKFLWLKYFPIKTNPEETEQHPIEDSPHLSNLCLVFTGALP